MSIDNQNIMEELIVQYFSEQLSDDDLERLNKWIAESKENEAHFVRLQEIWFASGGHNEKMAFNKEQAYQHFLMKVKNYSNNDVELKKRSIKILIRRVAVAAMLCVLFSGVGYYWAKSSSTDLEHAETFIEAPYGAKTKLYLPDGTLVWLNAGSSLKYSQSFGLKDRKLFLNGEAYFEVKKNESQTFEVNTADLSVRVLGTKFNFRNYKEEEEARVTLLEGKVSVRNSVNGEEFKIDPNQQIAYNKTNLVSKIVDVKAQKASEWTNGIIFFDEEKLPDIARELERLYNVQITIKDEVLKHYRFYGSFYRTDQTIQEVLDVLSSTNKLRYTIEGKKIELSKL